MGWPPLNLILNVRGVSKKFGEWYQKTNKTEDTNKLTLLAFKIIAILHNTMLAMFIKFLETVSKKGLFRNRSQNHCHTFLDYRHRETERSPLYSPDLAPTGARSGDITIFVGILPFLLGYYRFC
jgi:hypothetical protein